MAYIVSGYFSLIYYLNTPDGRTYKNLFMQDTGDLFFPLLPYFDISHRTTIQHDRKIRSRIEGLSFACVATAKSLKIISAVAPLARPEN